MVKAQTSSRMETLIQENTKKVSQMEKANTHGKMVLSMSENFVKALSMEKVDGRVPRVLNRAISTKVTILTTKSKDMVCSYGQAAIPIKESIKRTNVMGMAR